MDGVEADVDDEAVPRAPRDAREAFAVLVAEGRLDQLRRRIVEQRLSSIIAHHDADADTRLGDDVPRLRERATLNEAVVVARSDARRRQ